MCDVDVTSNVTRHVKPGGMPFHPVCVYQAVEWRALPSYTVYDADPYQTGCSPHAQMFCRSMSGVMP